MNFALKAAAWAAGAALGIVAATAAARRVQAEVKPAADKIITACDQLVNQLDRDPVKA